jgi:hypothetical protein
MNAVVDPAGTGPTEEGERLVVGVEDHLRSPLSSDQWRPIAHHTRIGAEERHPAVAKPDVRDLHDRRHAVDQDDLFVGVTVHRTVP